jgi:2,3-dihydroxy-2,3-dihydro-p-cumate dehydrogenase
MNKAERFRDQTVVVTGAARGIGLALAHAFAREGASLALADVPGSGIEDAARMVAEQHDVRTVGLAADLSQESGAQLLQQRTREAFGGAQVLVNNAGGGVILPFLSHTPETLRATIDRNLWTTLWCTRCFLPAMVEAGYGRIVMIGADSVRSGLPDHAAYNAAKGGVHGLTSGLAREFARQGITVNTVAPCAVNSEQMQRIERTDPVLARRFLDVIPMGRAAELDEVCATVTFVSSRDASFITGQVISVNGGSTLL